MTSNHTIHKCWCNWGDQCKELQSVFKANDIWFGKIRVKVKEGSILRDLIRKRFKIENTKRDYYLARHHWNRNFIHYMKKYKKFATTPFVMKVALEEGFHSSCVVVSRNKYICEPRTTIYDVKLYISSMKEEQLR